MPRAEIFRSYDVRGIVGDTLTEHDVYQVGRAFAAEALAVGQRRAVVGGDGRHTTPALRAALHRGLRTGGVGVIDIGCVPTPLLYYATHVLGTGTGMMITGSHNAPEYNGLKMVLEGIALAEEHIQALRGRIEQQRFSSGKGSIENVDLNTHYIDRVAADNHCSAPLKVVLDCGNGAAGLVAPQVLEKMGCAVVPLYADVDGSFPNHHPDPAEAANLEDLIAAVAAEGADVGLAFDGDGDRLGVVTNRGEIVWPDRTMMLFSQDIIARNPGAAIVFDVKCSRNLPMLVRQCGGRPIMWKTGHSHIKAKIRASGALFGGEFSGHFCFVERWYGFDDAIYSAARLVQILASGTRSAADVFASFPQTIATPEIKLPATEENKFKIIQRLGDRLASMGASLGAEVNRVDGVRLDLTDSWGLARASNTSPGIGLRFEADDRSALGRIQAIFDAALREVDAGLQLPSSSAAPPPAKAGNVDRPSVRCGAGP